VSSPEAACYSTPEEAGLHLESLPFERIPHQTRLFLDYLRDPVALRRFYPNAVRFHHELAARAPEVLAAHKADRNALCDTLRTLNTDWGAGAQTLDNIERLRAPDCVAVVSGQQIGLFTGPLYTIYKALTAVKLAGCLSQRGTQAVPVFWLATEDHDWAEVQTAEVIACDGRLADVSVPADLHREGTPVGRVVLDEKINDTAQRLFDVLPSSEFTDDLKALVRDAYAPGRTYAQACARLMTALVKTYGLILLDPLDARLKQLAAPLYAEAARRAAEIAAAIEVRSRELEAAGYHAQVHATADAFPLFLHIDGARHALARTDDGRYRAKGAQDETAYTTEELAAWAAREPEAFSPNVTLRAVVQDYLLPTIAYYGGAAEVAYFAQTAEAYRVLARPATPILHRASLTIVERRAARTLMRYGLQLTDFFAGHEHVEARVVEEHLGAEQARVFAETEASINQALANLRAELQRFEPTLADALTKGAQKIEHQLAGLRTRFHRAQLARDRAAHRQLERATTALYPGKTLQERRLNITSLLARHGRYCMDWIFNAIDLGSVDHQIVYL
jgi:bacillithiol biosynthesis cysteine-adding enzyme BshC